MLSWLLMGWWNNPNQQTIHNYTHDRMNLILTNAVEEREINIDDYKVNNISYNSSDSNSNEDTNNTRNTMTVYRRLTQAMIPGSKIVKFEIDQKIHDDRTKTVAAAAAAV